MHNAHIRVFLPTVASLALAGLLLAGCSAPSNDTSRPAEKKTVSIGYGGSGSLDPVLADQSATAIPDNVLYDTLINFDRKGQILPRLAESWDVSPDATSITITLDSAAKFHDGSPVTADDVVYTLDRVKRIGKGIASALGDYESAAADGETRLTIKLTKPNAIFLGALSKVFILNADLVRAHEGADQAQSWLASNEAGSGAYTLGAYTQGSEVRLTRYDGYWDGADGRPEQIVFSNVKDPTSGRNALLSGKLDASFMTPTDAEPLKSNSEFSIQRLNLNAQSYVFMNTQSPKLNDVRIRQAITLAFDYKGQVESNMKGAADKSVGILPSAISCQPEGLSPVQDIGKAKQLIKDAGADGLKLNLSYQSWSAEHTAAATLLQSNLKDIGVDVSLQTITYPAYIAALSSVETTPDMMILMDTALYPDAGVLLSRTYTSTRIGTGSNYGNYTNPEVDAKITEALAKPDEADRCELYKDAQSKIAADYVSVNIENPIGTSVVRKGISGLGESGTTYDVVNLMDVRVN